VVDLFCGAGGLSLAFHRAGFCVALAVERDKDAADTYRKSFVDGPSKTTDLVCDDVRSADVWNKLRALSTSRPIDVVIGGPPCQDFSPARLKARRQGHRAGLVHEYFKILGILGPRAFLFENVPGLKTAGGGRYWRVVEEEAEALGYKVFATELNAQNFGVPQRRRRLLVVGLKEELGPFSFPAGAEAAPSVMETIGHLPRLAAGDFDPKDTMHRARSHRPNIVEYMSHIKQGQAWREVRHIRVIKAHENHKGHYDVYGRIVGDQVAPTMTGGCTNPSRGRFIHPEQDRGLTVREAALLQTFPEDWQFSGGVESMSQQVGNAVPIKLGEAMALALKNILSPAPTSS
jgi:DNA (cytosine-5)-methyltransferase 1